MAGCLRNLAASIWQAEREELAGKLQEARKGSQNELVSYRIYIGSTPQPGCIRGLNEGFFLRIPYMLNM